MLPITRGGVKPRISSLPGLCTEGHARGDRLLQAVSETIVQSIRKLVKALDIMTSQSGWQVTASVGVVTCLEVARPMMPYWEKLTS